MSALDLDAIQARADAATEGPWEAWQDPYKVPPGRAVVAQTDDDGVCVTDDLAVSDAAFIAHARTDVPALVTELRDLRAALVRVQDLCDSRAAGDRGFLVVAEVRRALKGGGGND